MNSREFWLYDVGTDNTVDWIVSEAPGPLLDPSTKKPLTPVHVREVSGTESSELNVAIKTLQRMAENHSCPGAEGTYGAWAKQTLEEMTKIRALGVQAGPETEKK